MPVSTSDNVYWDRYTHAMLLSIYFKRVPLSLSNWNAYKGISNTLGRRLGLQKDFSESDALEYFILHQINNDFNIPNDLDIIALRVTNSISPNFLTDDSKKSNLLTTKQNSYLLNNLKIVMRVRSHGTQKVWGDNDIIVCLKQQNQIHNYCIISCKTSLRERVYQSIFWATHSRLEGVGKHVFLTLDKGRSGSASSEIGNRDQNSGDASKPRNALESTMDRVYVFRNSNEVNRSKVIKDVGYLEKDLIRWGYDFLGK
ncbi:MAG: hypothetical protein JJ882_12835 [Balneola sp.]|nr:hypothetical protein [Balneola sp.]